MKGISPIVATVLLVAITMTIAGVMAFWAQGFASKSLPVENDTTAKCRVAQFEFQNCKYNSTTQTIIFSLNNLRTVDLSGLKAYIEYPNGTVSSGVDLNKTLLGGQLISYSVSGVSSEFDDVLVKTNCPDISRSNICSR